MNGKTRIPEIVNLNIFRQNQNVKMRCKERIELRTVENEAKVFGCRSLLTGKIELAVSALGFMQQNNLLAQLNSSAELKLMWYREGVREGCPGWEGPQRSETP